MLRRGLLACLLAAGLSALNAQALRTLDTRTETPSWKLVAGGSVVATPLDTAYGFAMLTDGRMISAVGNSGQLLWQKGVKGTPSGYFSCESDFLLVVTNRDTLNLVNPSGTTLWSVRTGFDIIGSPRMGSDGRIFVRGMEHLACYGLHGVRKWLVRTEKQRTDIPLMLFKDGSVFAFLEATTSDRKSRAALYSPFGKEGDITTFTAYVTAAQETRYGALLALQGGGAGLCAVEDGKATSKWVTLSVTEKECPLVRLFADGEQAAFFFQRGKSLAVSLVSVKDGAKQSPYELGACSLSALLHVSTQKRGICISDDSRALLFSPEGIIIWEAQLPAKNNLAGVFYTDDDILLVYRKDWLMQAFVMQQSVSSPQKKVRAELHKSYSPAEAVTGTVGRMDYERISENDLSFMQSSFARGDYSENEEEWVSRLRGEIKNWIFDMNTATPRFYGGSSFFTDNPVYCSQILQAAAACGTSDFASLFSDLLALEKRKDMLIQILQTCATLAWDDEGDMLTQIEEVLHKANPRDTVLLKAVCDATYEICRYMGKPTLLSKGKNLLSFMLFPQFDSTTRDYARKTIQNILDLRL